MIKDKNINKVTKKSLKDLSNFSSINKELNSLNINEEDIFNITDIFLSSVKDSFEVLAPIYIPSIGTFKILDNRMESLEESKNNKILNNQKLDDYE